MNFAKTLNEVMQVRGYSKYKLAKILGVSQTTVANWLSGDTTPYKKDWDMIAYRLNIPKVDLFDVEDDEKTAAPEGDGLSDKDIRLLEWFRSLPPEKQKEVLYDAGAPAGLV